MEKIALKALWREKSGKGTARTLRRGGNIPAVLYSGGKSSCLTLNPKELLTKAGRGRREGILISLEVGDAGGKTEERTALLKDLQWDPVDGSLLHVDLFEISMDKPIRVKVPLKLIGTPIGVKDGGILQFSMREVEVECLPAVIPDHLPVDAPDLGIGGHFYVKDLQAPEGVTVLGEEGQAIFAVTAPVSEAKLEELLAAAPTEAGKEPELVKKPAKEEAEGKKAEGKKEEKG